MNEENKVFDGINVYEKQEYVDVVYPQMKENARSAIKWLQNSSGLSGVVVIDNE